MFAIVEAGGRQEKVTPGAVVVVDRLEAEPGAEVTFDRVLLVEATDGSVVAGTPYVQGATVTGVVEAQTKGKKIRVFKMKRRKQYRAHAGTPHAADARPRQEHQRVAPARADKGSDHGS